MAITIGRHTFDGPHQTHLVLENRSGVYAVLDYRGGKYHVLDIGESATVRDRLDGHDRRDCWASNSRGSIAFAALYTPDAQQSGRMAIEQELRAQFSPTCGYR